MRSNDITFRMNTGDHQGDEYGFTLATVNGKKAWTSVRTWSHPPSLIKEKIDLILTAREDNIPLSGARELARVEKILEDVETISHETDPVTLIGIDKAERQVRVDAKGRDLTPVVHETGKEPEYLVNLTCWSLYT